MLGAVPRPVLQRMASWAVPVAGLLYRGSGRLCPICGAEYRDFMPYGYVTSRSNALCPSCLSLERHRLLWLYLTHRTDMFDSRPSILHIAPEVCLMRRLKKIYSGQYGSRYVTADLESPLADVKLDVQRMPLADESFDVIFCNHILEHVEDDRLAMREMYRVMRSGGWGVMLSPVDLSLEHTFEDDSITDPAERTRIFGQYDHRRNYGRDYAERLSEAGFEVEEIDYAARFSESERLMYGLRSDEILYIVRKKRPSIS